MKKFVFLILLLISAVTIFYSGYKNQEITSVLSIKQKNGAINQVEITHKRKEKRFSEEDWLLIGKGNKIYFYREK